MSSRDILLGLAGLLITLAFWGVLGWAGLTITKHFLRLIGQCA